MWRLRTFRRKRNDDSTDPAVVRTVLTEVARNSPDQSRVPSRPASSRFWENRSTVIKYSRSFSRRSIAAYAKTHQVNGMKNVELSDEAYEFLQRIAAAKRISPGEVLTGLLGAGRPICGDHLLFHLTSGEFSNQSDPVERYLALLAWVARHHAADFADFISHQDSARRYLRLSPTEVNALRQEHHTCQIDATHYWAVMNIDDTIKGRFVRRLLEFIGCHDETVAEAIRALALPSVEPHRKSRLRFVA